MAVLVAVAQHEHAAGFAPLVENADDDVAVLAHDEMARRTGAVGEDRRAETRRQLDGRVTAARRRGGRRFLCTAGYDDGERG